MNSKIIPGLISLARPLNAVITFMAIIAAGIISGASRESMFDLFAAALAGLFLTAAGNTLNDVFDVETDTINKEQRAIVSGAVTAKQAVASVVFLSCIGLLLSSIPGALTFGIACISAVAIYAYNAVLKRIPLAGNFTVGILTGIAFVFGSSVTGNIRAAVIPALFACTFNWTREILKDVEDMEGDSASGIRTFPLAAGVPAALTLSTILLALVMVGSVFPYFFHIYSASYFWVVLFGVDTVLAYTIFSMWNDSTRRNIAQLAILLKYDMIVGIAAIVLGTR